MNSSDCQPQLQQPYRRETWQALLPKLLPGVELFARPHDFPLNSEHERGIATARRQFGVATLADGKRVAFYEIEVAPGVQLLANRVGLRNLVARCIDEVSAHAVLAFFVQPGRPFYRLTYAARESRLGEDLQVRTDQTAPRRFTYILGAGESCRTAAERFGGLPAGARLADLTEAFSVEKLNKEFFADFRKAFGLVATDILERNRGWERADAERETQTLLSRLLFLYFIQRKGWLNRQRNYLVAAFNRHHAEDAAGISFHDKFLKPFFVKLSDHEAFFPHLDLGDLPFLNGGLFDDEIGSLTERGRMRVGNPVLRHVFEHLLEAYNFTVREDTPLDQEVAIDPEMLGKIFESLVLQLEQSDTGGKTSRHDTGSYYTPRPIVHYLCREGLRAWLEQFPPSPVAGEKRGKGEKENPPSSAAPFPPFSSAPFQSAWPSRLEKLFALDAADGIDDTGRDALHELLTPDEARALLDRLDDFRACDPAVGSGAFLVGLLHELVNLHRLCETRSRGQDPAADPEWLYETKKRVIENVLYGVDLQQRAVEICKLRLWISLMVDYPLEVDPDNCALPDFRKALKKITPLPNLDFKIRRANSLIEQIRGHAVKFPQTAADSRDFNLSLNKLATAKHRFYEARKKKDKRLTQLDILEATAELAKYEFSAAKLKYGLLPSDKDAERAAELDRAEAEMGKLQMQIAAARKKGERDKDGDIERLSRVFNDEAKPTFVWQLDFAEIFHRSGSAAAPAAAFRSLAEGSARGDAADGASAAAPEGRRAPQTSGFDLVLANPPYVRQEKIKDLKPLLQNAYDCYTGTADLYVYFYELAFNLLNHGGALAFISSNSFLNSGFGKNLRQFLKSQTSVRVLIDFAETKVFTAITEPCIVVAAKRTADQSAFAALKWNENEKLDDVTTVASQRAFTISQAQLEDDGWRLEPPLTLRLLEKLRQAGKPLGEYVNGRFYYGIKTGLNEAFVVDRATRDELIAKDKSSADVLKPYLRGRDIRRWYAVNPELWLIFTRHGIDIQKYPAILEHLTPFRKELTPGVPGGRKPGSYKWFEIQDNIAYWREFEQPKIIYQEINRTTVFAWDASGFFCNNKTFILPGASLFLLAMLNSSAGKFYIHRSSGVPEGGFLALQSPLMKPFPIPTATAAERAAIEGLVERCLAARGENCGSWEAEINARVARLYGLTPAEIQLVEEATKK